jgi:acyl-CoA hydrolase
MGVKSRGKVAAGSVPWGTGLVAGVLLAGMAGIAASGGKSGRNFLLYGGLVVAILSVVLGCGGGGSAGQVATTTTVTSSILKAGFGTPVTFNVLVVPKGSATPTGSVQLFDNGSAFGNAAKVNAGIVSFLTTNLPVGVHVITAQYLGDANTLGSTSAPITQVITGNVAMQITGTSNGIVQTADFNVAVN